MEALMTLYIVALCYHATKANAVELAECFEHFSHDRFTRLLQNRCCWSIRLWQHFAQRRIGRWLARPR
jgi:hypothetical protein